MLVVDDDPNIRDLFEMALQHEGFQVVTATDGADATDKLGPKPPHLIVTDLMMPKQAGYDFLRTLPGAGLGRVRIIVITGSQLDSSTVDMIKQEAGVLEFFKKPVKMPLFIGAVHKHLNTAPRAKG